MGIPTLAHCHASHRQSQFTDVTTRHTKTRQRARGIVLVSPSPYTTPRRRVPRSPQWQFETPLDVHNLQAGSCVHVHNESFPAGFVLLLRLALFLESQAFIGGEIGVTRCKKGAITGFMERRELQMDSGIKVLQLWRSSRARGDSSNRQHVGVARASV